MKTENRKLGNSLMAGRNSVRDVLFLLAVLATAVSVSAQDEKPVVIEVSSIVPTEPVWLDDGTLAYKVCWAIHMSPTEYVPGSISHSKYDLAGGKDVPAGEEEYGYLSHDKRFLLSTERYGSMVIGQGMRDVKSHIKLVDRTSKETKTDFSCQEEVQGASLSPDGQVIIFAKQGNLWRLGVGESSAQIVVESKEKERFPQHSPDGKKIYFIRDMNDGTDFFAIDLASKAVVQVSRGLNPVSAFSFSPNGKYIAFASTNELKTQSEHGGNIWVLNVETGKAKRLTDGGTDQYPSFSPNGQRIVFQRQQGFYANSSLKAFNIVVTQPDLSIK
ncbi:MAG: hypothetical protein A2173_09255 [Planctomycetes bacterium RBG_13_44_8b]|nr:MAG: hypothetical protein A2173_09255 [Planctomycetes bacterium RBG_13_44_8b]